MKKKANVANPKDMNGKARKVVKDQHKGVVKKNVYDTASSEVHKKYGTMGSGPRRRPRFKKD